MSDYFKEPDLKKVSYVANAKKEELRSYAKQKKDKLKTLLQKKPALPKFEVPKFEVPKIDWVTIGAGSTFLILILGWYSIQYYDMFLPFLSGGLRLFKYFLICTAILYFMITFVQTSYYFYWWYASTLYFFRRFVDPLLNQKVKYYYYYFTDYINWLIYYPARAYYFVRFIANVLFFLLIILPIMAFIAFFIGLLFSWLGEAKDQPSILDPIVSEVKNVVSSTATQASTLAGNIASQASTLAGNIAKASVVSNASVATKASTLAGNIAKASVVSNASVATKVSNIAAKDLGSIPEMLQDPAKMADMVQRLDSNQMDKLLQQTQGTPLAGVGEKVKGLIAKFPGLLEKVKKLVGVVPKIMSLQSDPLKITSITSSVMMNSKLRSIVPLLMTEIPKIATKSPEQMLNYATEHPKILTAIMGATDALVKLLN